MMKPKILMIEEIEDDLTLRNLFRDKLVQEGFGVLEAKDGEEGLAIALRDHPDLILLDIMIPKMNGSEMLKKLREDKWGKTAKVIILTNLSGAEVVANMMGNEAFEYFVKADTRIEDIVKRIKEKLGNG